MGLYAITWFAFQMAQPLPNSPSLSVKEGQDLREVNQHIVQIFTEVNLPIPQNEILRLEVPNPEKIATIIYDQLRERKVDAYIFTAKEYVELRIYDIQQLRYRLRFAKEEEMAPILNTSDKESVKLSIVFCNVGDKDVNRILSLSKPITIAIQPNRPFSLRIAEKAALNWHEILVDVRFEDKPRWDTLPRYSGVLTNTPVTPLSTFVYSLYPSGYQPSDDSEKYKVGFLISLKGEGV